MAQLVERLPSTQNVAGLNPEAAHFLFGKVVLRHSCLALLCLNNTLQYVHMNQKNVILLPRSRSPERARDRRSKEKAKPHTAGKSDSNGSKLDHEMKKAAEPEKIVSAEQKAEDMSSRKEVGEAGKEGGEQKKPKVVTISRVVVTKKKGSETSKENKKESKKPEKEGIIAAVEAEQKRIEEEMQKRRERLEAWRKQRQKEEEELRQKMEEERKKAWSLEDDEDDEEGEEVDGEVGEGEEKMETEDRKSVV